ncbi:MAG: glycosyltransferase family 2 protein [Bacilli bacterium]
MKIEIICPLYKGKEYIVNLKQNIDKQEMVNIQQIFFVLTDTNDESQQILNENNCKYEKITPSEFSHSFTREFYALKSKADIIVFITQDIVIEDKLWLYNLIKNIVKDKADAAFSRQITKFNNIEKYTREKNYPIESRIVSKKDIERLGLYTFFFSDAASAVKLDVFKKLNGYDQKRLPISEDMYFAYKLIINDFKINYAADSVIYHSHNFSLKELYDRYKLTGKFFKQNSYLDQYGTNKTGGGMAKYVLKRAIQDKNLKVLFRMPFDMVTRFIGMKVGKYGR